MGKTLYTIISGTNRKSSNTINIARQYKHILAEMGITANLVSLEGMDLNLRNKELEELEIRLLIPTAKFIFIAPEYNGSIPGVLKSLIDNSDIKKVWWNKKALLTGVSTGRAGNLRGMEHLTGILQYVKMHVHHNKLPISVIDKLVWKDREIRDESTLKAIHLQLKEFIDY